MLDEHGQGKHDAAAHHKGQHMGDATHQVAVILAAQLFPVVGAEGVPAAGDGGLAGNRFLQQGIGVAHSLPCRGVHHPLADEPRQ